MSDIAISDFLKSRTQMEVAKIMGVTQGAVHQMVKGGREIYFRQISDGEYEYYEIKKSRPKKAA